MKRNKLTWLQVFSSILWACFGVQDSKTHKRDFNSNEKNKFIVAGISVLFIFVLFVFMLAKFALFYLN